jgi:hypothetical protein
MKRILLLAILLTPVFAYGQNVKITNGASSPALVNDAAYFAAAVTPADGTDLPNAATRGLWVGGVGNVKVDMVGGGTVTLLAVPAGTWLRIAAKRVYSTGTTATSIIALY